MYLIWAFDQLNAILNQQVHVFNLAIRLTSQLQY